MSRPPKKAWFGDRLLTLAEIAEATGVSKDTAGKHVRNGVWHPPARRASDNARLAEKLGVTKSCIQHRKRAGLRLDVERLKRGPDVGDGWFCWLVSDGERHGTVEAWSMELGVSTESVRSLVLRGKLERVGKMRLPLGSLERRFLLS